MTLPCETQHETAGYRLKNGWDAAAWYRAPFVVFMVILSLCWGPAMSLAQESPTSTPDADGNIIYIVQPNDSLWSIAARSGISLQELLDLNGIEETSVVNPGDQLLLGHIDPTTTPTPNIPTATLSPPKLTETPIPLRTAICITAFDDTNRNGALDTAETLLAGVAFTVFNDQIVVANYITDGVSEPFCLDALEAGTYHVTRSKSANEVLTTQGDWAMTLTEGSELNLAFGSYRLEEDIGASFIDSNSQFETRVAGTPAATPTIAVQRSDRTIAGMPLIIVLLGIGTFALLLATAVLLFWFAYSRGSEN